MHLIICGEKPKSYPIGSFQVNAVITVVSMLANRFLGLFRPSCIFLFLGQHLHNLLHSTLQPLLTAVCFYECNYFLFRSKMRPHDMYFCVWLVSFRIIFLSSSYAILLTGCLSFYAWVVFHCVHIPFFLFLHWCSVSESNLGWAHVLVIVINGIFCPHSIIEVGCLSSYSWLTTNYTVETDSTFT